MYDRCAINEAHPSYKQKPIIICGDLNVAATALDIKNPKGNVRNAGFTIEERDKFQNLLAAGYTDSFRSLHPDEVKYSWWSYRFQSRAKNNGWRLDYFLVSNNASSQIVEADILTDVMGSDHAPVLLQMNI